MSLEQFLLFILLPRLVKLDEIQAGIGTSRCPDQVFHLVNASDVPDDDRSFRNAWTYTP